MAVDSRFRKLFEPGRIGQLELKNRIVMPPMGTEMAAEDGHITERIRCYFEERARGGVGLIIAGVGSVDHPRGKCTSRQIGLSDDRFIPGLSTLTEAVHRHGAKMAIQLHHGGKLSVEDMIQGISPLSSSEMSTAEREIAKDLTAEEIERLMQRYANMPRSMMTREMMQKDISQLVQRFAEAAERAKKAGFDGVEIHAGHGYLISQFLSRSKNKRRDTYGGELQNRARFLLEIVEAVRDKVGDAYPMWCRIDGREFGIEDGITPEDGQALARMIEEAGVDAVHVSGYGGPVGGFYEAPLVYPPGNLLPLAQRIKREVRIPVIAVGRISPAVGESTLRHGKADFIAMGRPLLADPDLPRKLAAGEMDDIRPCIYCYNCVGRIFQADSVSCAVNAITGKEAELRIQPVERAKKIVVVGGGPAGMEAARVAALRGHDVVLYEKSRRLGGSLLIASLLWRENEDLLKYFLSQIRKLNVKVNLGKEATPELIEGINADATVLAQGSTLSIPQIPGIDRRNVISVPELQQIMCGQISKETADKLSRWQRLVLRLGSPLLHNFLTPSNLRSFTRFWMPLGKRVTIIGGDIQGCQLAEFLVERRRKVTVLESSKSLAAGVAIPRRWRLLQDLRNHGVVMLTGVKFEEITQAGVSITDKEGQRLTIEADSIILTEVIQSNDELLLSLAGRVSQVYPVGDCARLGLIEGAIADGMIIGAKV